MASTVANNKNGFEFKLNKLCRVCLVSNTQMNQLFEENQKIINDIEFCTGILFKETEGLPEQICKTCLENLSIARNFKTQCLLSVQTFEKVINNIKEEKFLEEDYLDGETEIKSDIEDSSIIPESDAKIEIHEGKLKQKKPRGPYKKKSNEIRRIRKYKYTRLSCQPCGLKFQNKDASSQHNQNFHNDSWICEICGKQFAHRSSHYTHTMSHFPPRFSCDHCDYRSSIKGDLAKHIRIHFGIKNYKCRLCPHSFTTVSNQLDHERRYHNKVKRYSCTACEMTFYDRSKLNRHLDSHNSVKRFECEVCHTFFTRRCHWKRHMMKQHNIAVPPQRPGRKRGKLPATELRAVFLN